MANLDTTRQPVSAPVDSGAPWAPDTSYTVDNNLFRVTETIPADAVDIDGNAIVPNGLYCYPTVPHTSPASLTVADLALMKRKGGSPDTISQPFGDAQISIISPVVEGDRRHITLENASATGFGISNYLFHLSDDPSVVGTLSGTAITLQQGVAKDLYLVGPSTAGVPSDGDLQHNGTISAAHFTVTFDGFGLTYNLIAGHRIHPGDGNGAFDVRTFSEVAAVGPINFIETDFGLLFQGFAITPGQASTPIELSLGPNAIEAGYTLVNGVLDSSSTAAFKNVIPEVSNGAGANTGNISTTFTPTETRGHVFELSLIHI